MDAERKKSWRCDKCVNKTSSATKAGPSSVSKQAVNTPQNSSNISSNLSDENYYVTKRNHKKTRLHVSSEELAHNLTEDYASNTSSTLLEDTPKSLPNLSVDDDSELIEEINLLKTQLASAHAEIERLNIQVTNLQKIIESQQKKSKIFKQLLSEPSPRKLTPSKSVKIKHRPLRNIALASSPKNTPSDDDIANFELTTLPGTKEIRQHEMANNSKETTPTVSFNEQSQRIVIIGDQTARNMATSLAQTRSNYKNPKKYFISGIVYPNASIEHVIQCSKIMIEELQEDDWLVLCLGSNDSNPIKIGVELSSLLKKQNKAKILVTSVIENPYLNVKRLNSHIQTILKCFKNVNYLDLSYNGIYPYRRVNNVIDTIDYKKYFLCNSKNNNGIPKADCRSLETNITAKPGTIPFYFKTLRKHKTANDGSIPINKKVEPPKGTIPYYFKTVKKYVCTQKDTDQLFR
ncbi:unnamed protein product [Parnassius apollo]|uniref:(apollo) hypothetical protein n=1 Tax=Parnassius apollo TaxID=110799 RepID=A0A8S3Y688_PARAO|nr:unnamed protein product [Parnassius apollo]